MPSPTGSETLEGTLERVVFSNPENAWSVVRLAVAGEREPVTAVGPLGAAQPGERLRLEGAWQDDPKYGRQFRAARSTALAPATVEGIERYLGSGMIEGIGKTFAARLVEAFGVETLEVIEHHPERLRRIPGIGAKRSAAVQKALLEQREIKEVMVFLQGHEVPTHLAVKIYRRYGDGTMAILRRDPYRLAREVTGIGFASADRIAGRLGISEEAPERVRAGVLHVLGEAAGAGHTLLPEDDLARTATELLAVERPAVEEAIAALARAGDVVVEPLPAGRGGVDGDGDTVRGVSSAYLHAAETALARRLATLVERAPKPLEIDVERALLWFERREGIELAGQQREAIRRAIGEKVLVVTGGPGTGKTTLVRGVVEILGRKGRRIRLAAPTGRAAKRLAEASGQEATTLHRLLEFEPGRGGFARGGDRPLDADLVLVDEASMLDTVLAGHLAAAVPDAAQLILVGDVDQLPSVGPGNVLADLIRSGRVPVVRLTEVFRQAAESGIVANAHRVNRGEMPVWSSRPDGDFFFIPRAEPEAALEALVEVVVRRIPESFGLDPIADLQVLAPMNRGILGVENLNRVLGDLLNPRGREVVRAGRRLRVGDKVMQIRNNYELEVFNGDLGRIEAIDEDEQTVRSRFDGRAVEHPFSALDELVPAYACSIHKSQGSEYPAVVVPLHGQHYVMLERNLLYTALTRAARLVVLIGERRALRRAVTNRRNRERHTLLARRLRDERPAADLLSDL